MLLRDFGVKLHHFTVSKPRILLRDGLTPFRDDSVNNTATFLSVGREVRFDCEVMTNTAIRNGLHQGFPI